MNKNSNPSPSASPKVTTEEEDPTDVTAGYLIGCMARYARTSEENSMYACYVRKDDSFYVDPAEFSNIQLFVKDQNGDTSGFAKTTTSPTFRSLIRFTVEVQSGYILTDARATMTDPDSKDSMNLRSKLSKIGSHDRDSMMRLIYLSSTNVAGNFASASTARATCAYGTPFDSSNSYQRITPLVAESFDQVAADFLKQNALANLISPRGKLVLSNAQILAGQDLTLQNQLTEDFWGNPVGTNLPSAVGVWTGFAGMTTGNFDGNPRLECNLSAPEIPWTTKSDLSFGTFGNMQSTTNWLLADPNITASRISCNTPLRLICIL